MKYRTSLARIALEGVPTSTNNDHGVPMGTRKLPRQRYLKTTTIDIWLYRLWEVIGMVTMMVDDDDSQRLKDVSINQRFLVNKL